MDVGVDEPREQGGPRPVDHDGPGRRDHRGGWADPLDPPAGGDDRLAGHRRAAVAVEHGDPDDGEGRGLGGDRGVPGTQA
jgi:hypothetical protein